MNSEILLYNYNDLNKIRRMSFKTSFSYFANKNWTVFRNYKQVLDTTRWINYIINPQNLFDRNLSNKALSSILEVASYRELVNYTIYGDSGIYLELIEHINIDKIPLTRIDGNKLYLTFEEN